MIAWDQDDTATMRAHAQVLMWDKKEADGTGGMDLENDLAVSYTLLRKKADAQVEVPAPRPGTPMSQ